MSFDAAVTLNSQTFNTGTADGNGSLWFVTDLEGWDSPPLRQSFGNPTSRHGSVILESMLDHRPLTMIGVCKATTEAFMWTAYNSLTGDINALVTPVDLIVYESVPKKVSVVRGGQIRLNTLSMMIFSFEIPLIAPDPLKYSVA